MVRIDCNCLCVGSENCISSLTGTIINITKFAKVLSESPSS